MSDAGGGESAANGPLRMTKTAAPAAKRVLSFILLSSIKIRWPKATPRTASFIPPPRPAALLLPVSSSPCHQISPFRTHSRDLKDGLPAAALHDRFSNAEFIATRSAGKLRSGRYAGPEFKEEPASMRRPKQRLIRRWPRRF